MISRSFVDLLFILLCAAIVMLANSSPLRVAEADPARAAGGGTLDLAGRELRLLVVGETELWIGEEPVAEGEAIATRFAASDRVVIVPSAVWVTHHRVIEVWSQLQAAGVEADLGVVPAAEGKENS
jgi:biopolymer transport protein ExbD